MYQELENKIKSMTAKEIILAMIDSLKNPLTKIDMDSFGHVDNGICYGCAATNTICKIGDLNPNIELNADNLWGAKYARDSRFIEGFERAIDYLRLGSIKMYNNTASSYGFALIKSDNSLPEIDNLNYQDSKVLEHYLELANNQ